mgnify:FL=1
MKRIKIFSAVAVGLLALASCSDQMNYNEYYVYDRDYMTQEFGRVEGFLTTAYNEMDYDYGGYYSNALMASATDESEYAYNGNSIEDLYNGALNPTNSHATFWTSSLKGIAYCNLFLDEFADEKFTNYEYNDDYAQQMFKYKNMRWEARFLRAYYYFRLVRQYNGAPLYCHNIPADDLNRLPMSSADKVFDFIKASCDSIKDSIVVDYTNLGDMAITGQIETGRANQLAVLALKARAALYHASPLFNQNNEAELWHQAALATKELVDSAEKQGKALAATYDCLWAANNYTDKKATQEILFYRSVADANTLEKANFPVGLEGCNGGNCPTQDLVDAYEMQSTGKGIKEEGSGYDAQNPYTGRDPRFELTICHNETKRWPNWASEPIYTYQGGANALPLNGGTPTGYYLKKLLNAAIDTRPATANTMKHSWVIFRMGEAYLNYAEAVFQYFKSQGRSDAADATSAEFPVSARELASKTRLRSKMKAMPAGMSNADFWAKYQNERRVELAFEGYRFWDVRRWKEGAKYFSKITEMHITKNEDGTYTYTPKTVNRVWDEKFNFFPIPQSDIMKNPNLDQSITGWK